jgi:putative ABC transport system permease protein
MASLAFKNLLHDKVRLIVTLTGIVFSVVLTAIQLGLFVGFINATSDVIDYSRADLWVMSKGVPNLENGVAFSERKLNQVRALPEVKEAQKQIVTFANWKLPSGAVESCLLIGFAPDSELGAPWKLVQGSAKDLDQPDTVIIDELYQRKLGVTHIGQVVELRGYRARVIGFTRGIRTFTTSPTVFTSFKNAQNYFGLKEDQTLYLLIKAVPNADLQKLKKQIISTVKDVDVYTTPEFSRKQANYWMFGTGAGVTVLIAAALGLLVGIVIVAQTIYASTVDHIREYGTLKAMGASNAYIYRVIIKQAAMSGVLGYLIGIAISLTASSISQQGTTAIMIPNAMIVALFVLTIVMCIGASVVSINKVMTIDPAMVFKG